VSKSLRKINAPYMPNKNPPKNVIACLKYPCLLDDVLYACLSLCTGDEGTPPK